MGTSLSYARSPFMGYSGLMNALRDALDTYTYSPLRHKRLMKIVVGMCDHLLSMVHPIGYAVPPHGFADAVFALRNACAAYDIMDSDGSMARVLAVCALLDIDVRTGP